MSYDVSVWSVDPFRDSVWPGLSTLGERVGALTFLTTPDWSTNADVTELVGLVPEELAMPFMARWIKEEGPLGGYSVRWPTTYPAVFPLGTSTSL